MNQEEEDIVKGVAISDWLIFRTNYLSVMIELLCISSMCNKLECTCGVLYVLRHLSYKIIST